MTDQAPGIVLPEAVEGKVGVATTGLISSRGQRMRTTVVAAVSLPVELGMALLGGVIAGLGSFVGTATQTNVTDFNQLKTSGIAAGFVALTFFTNSLRNWYGQKYGVTN